MATIFTAFGFSLHQGNALFSDIDFIAEANVPFPLKFLFLLNYFRFYSFLSVFHEKKIENPDEFVINEA